MVALARRILVAELDSVATRRLYDDYSYSAVEAESQLVAALRVAHMVGGQILVTDSMLFDSRFFTGLDPSEMATLLGAPPNRLPLTVLFKEPTLADALQTKLDRRTDFRWQLAGREQVDGWAGPRIHAAWARWIRAAERGQIECESLLTLPDGTAKQPFELNPDMRSDVSEPAVKALVDAASRGDRSAVFHAYDAGLAGSPDGATVAELKRLRGLYNAAYFDAMARQHDAEWVSVIDQGGQVAQTPGRTLLRVSGTLVEIAAQAPPAVFSQIMYATTEERATFFHSRRRRHLLALAYRAEAATSTPGMWEAIGGTARAVVFALLAILIAVPGLSDAASWLPWTTFAVAVVLAVPWDALGTVKGLLPSRLDASLSVRAR